MSEGAMSGRPTGATYEGAGVSIEAGDRAVQLMKVWVDQARRPEMIGGIGGFAGLFDASALKSYDQPLLATSADGVGTKVAIAQALDKHDTIGFDLVGMLVDDLVVCGAEPLFLIDYIATGRVVPERIAAIVKGIAEACVAAGCGLIGGETAEHPGLLEPDEYDVAGSTTGVVEASQLLGPGRVRPGDVVIAMASSGLHSNGYSLVRQTLFLSGMSGPSPWNSSRARRRPRPDPRRGAARADPDLRQGLPGPRSRHRDPRDVAHHRWRAGRQPRTGPARRARRHPRPHHLVAAAGVPPGRRDRRGGPRGPGADPELRRGHGLAHRGGRRRPRGLAARRPRDRGLGRGHRGTRRRPRTAAGCGCTATTPEPSRHRLDYLCPVRGPRCGNHHRPVRVVPRTDNSDRLPAAAPAIRARGSTQWGAAVQRRSRPRLPAI